MLEGVPGTTVHHTVRTGVGEYPGMLHYDSIRYDMILIVGLR